MMMMMTARRDDDKLIAYSWGKIWQQSRDWLDILCHSGRRAPHLKPGNGCVAGESWAQKKGKEALASSLFLGEPMTPRPSRVGVDRACCPRVLLRGSEFDGTAEPLVNLVGGGGGKDSSLNVIETPNRGHL